MTPATRRQSLLRTPLARENPASVDLSNFSSISNHSQPLPLHSPPPPPSLSRPPRLPLPAAVAGDPALSLTVSPIVDISESFEDLALTPTAPKPRCGSLVDRLAGTSLSIGTTACSVGLVPILE
ncbi:hypothetical protein AKJ16_DCAP04545 [Drosera capensis]